MSKEYFKKCKKFEKEISSKIKLFITSLCKECPHQQDQHEMNCLECCPVKRGDAPNTPYENQNELAEKQDQSFKKLLLH